MTKTAKIAERDNSFHSRLALLIGTEEPFRWAKRIGIPAGTFARIWKNGSVPKQEHLCRIAEKTGASLDWLLMGRGVPDFERMTDRPTPVSLVSVTELANCGLEQGWYNETALGYKIAVPSFLKPEGGFAVLCKGMSMVPAGIPDGSLCIVSPKKKPEAGKAVLLRTKSFVKGKEVELSTIKLFEKADSNAVYLTGWLNPDDTGSQSPFSERRSLSRVTMIAPVCFVLDGIDSKELFDSGIDSQMRLDEELLIDCFEVLRPLYKKTDSDRFAKMFACLYRKCLETGGADMKTTAELMRIIGGNP